MLCVRLVEETCISVLAFGYFPHIEALGHHHHAHLVADIHLPGAGCVVRCANGIAPHLLEQAHLTPEGILIEGGTCGSHVVMETHAAEFALFSVEEESLLVIFCQPDAHLGLLPVTEFVVLMYFCDKGVEDRMLWAPQEGLVHVDGLDGLLEVFPQRFLALSCGLATCIQKCMCDRQFPVVCR